MRNAPPLDSRNMKRPRVHRRREGFTLIETIVTVSLLAVLAAFVVPTVIQKTGAGDPVKGANDLNSIRTWLDNFSTDTKAGFPPNVWQLTPKPYVSHPRLHRPPTHTEGQ